MENTVMEQEADSGLAGTLEKFEEKDALIEFAGREYGVNLDKALSLAKMRKLVLELHAKIQEVAKAENEEAAKEVACEEDPLVKFTFKNMDSPGQPVELVYDHGRGIKYSKRYTLYDGKTYNLPLSLYLHLRSLTVPNDTYELDPTTGMVSGINRAVVNRFACEIDLAAMTPDEVMKVQQALQKQ